jgi:hypothetical protein
VAVEGAEPYALTVSGTCFCMTLRILATAVMAALLTAQPAAAQDPRAVVELFTSQGCSSCPAADRLLAELATDRSVIALSLNVDYWDYLGWKDTLALKGHTERERAYAKARGDREVYTPQAVVNGLLPVLGSDKGAIETAIAKTSRSAAPLALPVTLKVENDKVSVSVPDAKDERASGEVWLCPVTSKAIVAIARGENSGKTITYHNVVRRWVKLGDWTGKAETFSAPLKDVAGADIDSFAVLVQSGVAAKPGVVLGAAMTAR